VSYLADLFALGLPRRFAHLLLAGSPDFADLIGNVGRRLAFTPFMLTIILSVIGLSQGWKWSTDFLYE
jgi:hypothetical protein